MRIVVAAGIAGIVAGLLLTVGQQWRITSLIRTAEVLETAGLSHGVHGVDHPRDSEHAWHPQGDRERLAATAVANVVLGTGYALLLAAGLTVRRQSGWSAGLGWGIAGFIVFFAAPSLGLPPDLPGAPTAALSDRVWWWCFTVGATATGLWLVFFGTQRAWRAAGLALIAVPHLFGAPQGGSYERTATLDLMNEFAIHATLVNLAFWLALGLLTGGLLRVKKSLYSRGAATPQ